jgi:hypothetical protein
VSDLTTKEQGNVRTALLFLRTRTGADTLSKVLKADRAYLRRIIAGHDPVSASVAVRVARVAGVGVDDVLTGKYPLPGTCAHCGHRAEDAKAAE